MAKDAILDFIPVNEPSVPIQSLFQTASGDVKTQYFMNSDLDPSSIVRSRSIKMKS